MRVPKWFLDLRSSLKRQIRRPFYLQLLPSDFFYRLNAKAEQPRPASLGSGSEDLSQAACYTLCSYRGVCKGLRCYLKLVFIKNVSWTIGSDHSYTDVMVLQNRTYITYPPKVLSSSVLEP